MPSWFKNKRDEELPEEIRGKSPEEVAKSLKDAADQKARLDALEAERVKEKEQVVAMNSEFQQVKQRLIDAEANLHRVQNPPRTEEPADWNIEPEKAFKQNVAPLVNVVIQNSKLSAKMLAVQTLDNEDNISPQDARTMNGRLFRAWDGEIEAEANKYPAASMGQAQVWIGIFYLIKGRHADELANPEKRKKNYNFLESGTPGAPPPPPKPKDGVEALTDQEKHVADRMGVKYEDYAKRKKSMTIVPG